MDPPRASFPGEYQSRPSFIGRFLILSGLPRVRTAVSQDDFLFLAGYPAVRTAAAVMTNLRLKVTVLLALLYSTG